MLIVSNSMIKYFTGTVHPGGTSVDVWDCTKPELSHHSDIIFYTL